MFDFGVDFTRAILVYVSPQVKSTDSDLLPDLHQEILHLSNPHLRRSMNYGLISTDFKKINLRCIFHCTFRITNFTVIHL